MLPGDVATLEEEFNAKYLATLALLGDFITVPKELHQIVEEFVCDMYQQPKEEENKPQRERHQCSKI